MNEKYIPLYRKYRPQTLEEIVGQSHIKKALTNAIEMDRISHAYLFTGPRGTGKTSTARIFAKSLNCKEGPTIHPCGKCENCIDITNSVPMDVIEIDAASNRKVEDAQNILEKVMYAPVNSRYKIYIIDEVHMLSTTAFNALLKTLEEPPKNVIFILATTDPQKVLDTIKSRCQRFDFKRITTDDIVKHLRYISDTEKINITDDALYTIAKNSAGGMRDSIALLDQLSILDGEEAISTDDINNLLGRLSFDTLHTLACDITSSNPQNAIENLEKIYNSGNEPTQILLNLMDYFKNLLIVKNCRAEIVFELTQLNEAQVKELQVQSKELETHQITALIDKIANYVKDVKSTNNPRLWLEVGIIDLANLTENTTLADLQNRLARLEGGMPAPMQATAAYKTPPTPVYGGAKIKEMTEQKPSAPKVSTQQETTTTSAGQKTSGQTPTPAPQRPQEEDFAPMPKAKSVASDDISVLWGQLLENISSPPARALLKQWANPVKITPEETILSMKNEIFLTQIQSGSKKAAVEAAVDALFSQQNSTVVVRLPLPEDVQIKAVRPRQLSQSQPKPMPKAHEPEPQEEITQEEIQEAKNDTKTAQPPKQKHHAGGHSDMVNMVMDLFDGKIID